MTDENKNEESRIEIEDLPETEQELTDEEAKDVKGGIVGAGAGAGSVYIKEGDGSVKPQNVKSPRDSASGLCSSRRE